MDPAELGWKQALATYRPFLSYNELGSMLDEGPSKLFDALSAILGLEELTQAQDTLAEARKAREKAHKEAGQKRDEILGLLRQMDDDRARTLVAALERKDWGLAEADKVLAQAATGTGQEDEVQILRQLASLQAPTREAVAAVANDLQRSPRPQEGRRRHHRRKVEGPGRHPRPRPPLPQATRRRRLPGLRQESRPRRQVARRTRPRKSNTSATRREKRPTRTKSRRGRQEASSKRSRHQRQRP